MTFFIIHEIDWLSDETEFFFIIKFIISIFIMS